MRKVAFGGLVALLVMLGGACAHSTGANQGGIRSMSGGAAEVRIINDLMPPTSLTIRIIPTVGTTTTLGLVNPQETATLVYPNATTAGSYVLAATTQDGVTLRTDSFSFPPEGGVTWDVYRRTLRKGH